MYSLYCSLQVIKTKQKSLVGAMYRYGIFKFRKEVKLYFEFFFQFVKMGNETS